MTGDLFPHDGSTRVVNLKVDAFDVYIGRARKGKPPRLCSPGEEGFWGNPFPISKCGPNALPWFEKYFNHRCENDAVFRAEVFKLRGKRLGCFCVPQPCHGQIIVRWLEAHPCPAP